MGFVWVKFFFHQTGWLGHRSGCQAFFIGMGTFLAITPFLSTPQIGY
jgi:hypothetical protein